MDYGRLRSFIRFRTWSAIARLSSSSLLGMRSKGVADDTLVAADPSLDQNAAVSIHLGVRISSFAGL